MCPPPIGHRAAYADSRHRFPPIAFAGLGIRQGGSMRAWLSSVLATKPLGAGHKPRIPASWNADRRRVAGGTHHIDRNAGYTGLAAQPTTSVRRGRHLDGAVGITNF